MSKSFWSVVTSIFSPGDQGDSMDETAQDYAAADTSQADGAWIDARAYYSEQDSPAVAQAITDGLSARGYLVEQVHVPTASEIFGAVVVAKVGLPFSEQGAVDPRLASQALSASLGRFTNYSQGASDTASQVNEQVVQPTIAQAKQAAEFGGIALGTLAVVGAVLYLFLLTGGLRGRA